MYYILLQCLIVSSLSSITCAKVIRPIISVQQGVIEKDGVLPIFIFWYHPSLAEGDRLFISSVNSSVEYAHYEIESEMGFYELPHSALEHGETPDDFCVVIFTNDETLDENSSCESKAQWMYDRREALEYFSLVDLVIPGTHQSAAYGAEPTESVADQSYLSRWILCQTKSIKSQLMDGIRYLDLRPGSMNENGKVKYLLTHNVFNLITMDEAVQQITEFLDHSRDIVIVSFREFYKGFSTPDDHSKFINYLEESFGKYAHERRFWTQPLLNFWNSDKRLILSYEHPQYNTSKLLWTPIIQYWGNVQTISRLHSFLAYTHRSVPFDLHPYAAMAELTHSVSSIAQDVFTGDASLRHWGELLGRYIPRWYSAEWFGAANIIAVDFYQTSGIVDIAIQLSERRAW